MIIEQFSAIYDSVVFFCSHFITTWLSIFILDTKETPVCIYYFHLTGNQIVKIYLAEIVGHFFHVRTSTKAQITIYKTYT
jgi:lipid-A-disaccharide synthase-like uncharacterized protein